MVQSTLGMPDELLSIWILDHRLVQALVPVYKLDVTVGYLMFALKVGNC